MPDGREVHGLPPVGVAGHVVALALPRRLELVGDDEADGQAQHQRDEQDREALLERGRVLR